VRVTPTSSSEIKRIEVECLCDNTDRRKLPLLESTPMGDPITLAAEASTPAPSMEEEGISTPSSFTVPFTSVSASTSRINTTAIAVRPPSSPFEPRLDLSNGQHGPVSRC